MQYLIPLFTFLIFLGIVYPRTKHSLPPHQVLIWNVGQGQMITYLSPTHCHHIDMGGEKFPKKKLFNVCRNKKNDVRYTHWDFDHVNFSLKAKKIFPSLCRIPNSNPIPPSKKHFIQKIPLCTKTHSPDIQQIRWTRRTPPKTSNESSLIFVIKKQVLIPGDSPSKMEKYWASKMKFPIRILVTGHHGSRTSTSSYLLNHLPFLQLAISSSRKKRYGHPHRKTIHKLKRRGVNSISTEDIGHIRIPLDLNPARPIPF